MIEGLESAMRTSLLPPHDSDARFREVFQNAGVGMIEIDADWNILASNATYCRITGRSEDELRGANCLSFTHAEDVDAGARALQSLAAGTADKVSFEKRYLRPDGSTIWVRSNLSRVSGGQGANRFLKVVEDITDVREAREALRESEEFNRRILASSSDCIKVLSLEGRLESMSPGGLEVMEIDDFDALQGKYWPELWPEDERDKVATALADAKAGRIGRFQGFCPTGRGALKRWDVIVSSIVGTDEKPEKLLSISRDITAQHQLAERQRESETRFREVFENAGVGMIEIDADWNILASNAAYRRITARTESDLTGANCLSFTHREDVDVGARALQSLAAATTDKVSFEKRYLRPDGATVWVRSNLSRVSGEKGANRFLKVVEDITHVRQAQEALRESEARFRTLFQSIDEGFCIIEFLDGPHGALSDYVHVAANPAYEKHAGIPNIVGQKLREMVPDEADRWAAIYREVLLTGEPVRFEQELMATGRHLELAAFRVEPKERRQVAVLFQDVTARKRAELELKRLNETLELRVAEEVERRGQAEEALRQAQKMEAVGQLTGGIAHDFNNLLTVITGNVDAARRHLGDTAEARVQRALGSAMIGAERAAVLTQRLLAFSRRQPLDPKPIDVNKLVGGMAQMLHSTLGETIALETVGAAGLWRIEADPHQLENAIINLAVNARDAMGVETGGSGKLTIETANTHLDRDYAAQNAGVTAGQYVVICVSDTGHGMDEETLERVFEPFFTTKEVGKGTGLGLSMVYGFVKQSGGHVKLYTEVGVGTTVRIYLPRFIGDEDEEKPGENAIVPEGSRDETILVCEDDDDVRAYTVEVLRELGYRVLEAHDGPSALRLLERQEGKVDLLFTDVVLPAGMTGAVLAAQVREMRPDIRILFTTGYARNAIVHHGRLDAGVELITKPFSYADLAARVRDMLDRN